MKPKATGPQPERRTTIRDISRETGLSTGAISQIMNGKRKGRPENIRKIMETIQRLDYSRNLTARNLSLGRTNTIGFIFYYDMRDMFNAQLFAFAENCVKKNGYDLLPNNLFEKKAALEIQSQGEPGSPQDIIYANLIQRRVDGILAQGYVIDEQVAERLTQEGIAVSVWEPEKPMPDNVAVTKINYTQIMDQSIDHLFDLGHRRIGLIAGMREFAAVREGVQAFQEALRTRGILDEDSIFYCDSMNSEEFGRDCILNKDLRGRRLTALVCFDDRFAMGVLTGCHQKGIRVPDELSVVGIDDVFYSAYTCPPLTTVQIDVKDAAQKMVNGMFTVIQQGKGETQYCECRLIVRGSTAVPDPKLT